MQTLAEGSVSNKEAVWDRRGVPQTLEEVGEAFDVTRERIRQIQVKAIRKLRASSKIAEAFRRN